ncbi:hypothetical protein F4777DRAFT_412912 [Nemania sp. FL0916]|nr:hypothetical protein F4777DRAFT_412912 [Nemania sp. FL0916]
MDSSQYLRFLRPYLFRSIPANRAAYTGVFFVSRANVHCESMPCLIQQKRAFTNSSVMNATSAESTIIEEKPITATRATKIEDRTQKLREYDALRFPRIGRDANRMTIPEFREKFKTVEVEQRAPPLDKITLEGRILSIRRSGSKLAFMHISGGYQQVQVMVDLSHLRLTPVGPKNFQKAITPLRRGDFISVTGLATRTYAGELTLAALALPVSIAPALAPLPEKLINDETKILNRHVDMLVNQQTSDMIRLRSHVIKSMRDFFHERHFLEVQTPILADSAGGATARPFVTTSTALPEKKLSMRIAPELWLKRLVIGGNDRVFEIGPSFRNEGLDTTHNPEFTSCEFYSAYSNLADLMTTTQMLVRRLIHDVDQVVATQLTSLETPKLSAPKERWTRMEFIPALEKILNIRFPDLSKPDALDELLNQLPKHIVLSITPGLTLNKTLDQLASKYLESQSASEYLDQPFFITHHPACMAPLSKSFVCPKTGQLVSARAELFINGYEVANMYEEENDPFEQRRKFQLQLDSKDDDAAADAPEIDESYVQALEYGLPPTGGWGCGVDRLIMLLSGASRISDTLPFGSLKNIVSLSQAAKSS